MSNQVIRERGSASPPPPAGAPPVHTATPTLAPCRRPRLFPLGSQTFPGLLEPEPFTKSLITAASLKVREGIPLQLLAPLLQSPSSSSLHSY